MSQASKFDQFIYGKFVGNESGYRVVSYSENLNNISSDLLDIAETNYSFWGSQSGEQNPQAVGICRNNTPILPEKKIILIQAYPAISKDKSFVFRSGSRSFFQHRYIFVSEAEIAEFNNRIVWLLKALGDMAIPSFSDVNTPYGSEKNSWLLGKESFLELLPVEEGKDEKVKNTIKETWKRLPENGKNILLQGLAVILNGKRLLLSGEQKAKKLALKILDNLLLFLPTNERNKISLAIGSVDPKYCNWAQIIVKLDSSSIGSLPENMVCLDLKKYEFDKEEYLHHEYVKDFIAPNKDRYKNLITICEYLDKTNKDYSDNLAWEFQEVDGWLKLNNPSLDFIFHYPAEEPDKIEILGKYIPRMEEKVQSFLDKFGENLSTPDSKDLELLEFLWQALPIPENNGDLIKTLLCKIYRYLPDKFLEIIKEDDKFFNSLAILIKNQFIEFFVDENLRDDILQALKNACLKLITNISQGSVEDLYNKSGNIVTELQIKYLEHQENSTKNYPELEKLIIGCEKIFSSEKEKFHLWDLAVVGEITRDNFKHLFIKRLFPFLDKETFEQSNLKQYWQENFPDTLGSLNSYLLEKEKGIFHIREIANGLKLSNDEASELYLTCLKSHSPTYEQSLPLLESAIQKSISPVEEGAKFQTNNFMEVYQWFNSQYFQDKSPDKPDKSPDKVELFSIFSNLVMDSNSNPWINWEKLSEFLYKDNVIKQTIFLDKTIGEAFLVEMLETWLQLLNNHQENKEVEKKFIDSKAWELLNCKTLRKMREELTGTYHKYVGKFIQWANKYEHNDNPVELISGELIEYITQIWHRQKSIDENLWNLLNSEEVLPKLSNTDCLNLIDIHWRLSADSLLLMLTNLYKKAEKFSQEEKESLMKCATEIVHKFQDRQSLKKFINKCRLFYDNSGLLEIMNYANNDVRKDMLYDDIIR
ncbi:hypothetical protein [Okeania sp. SIO1I7]|uniref:hypothetical protein n=1 Tax=Okeania sp. SIO1I7 TaxID=2607772 RepID=UPI0013F913F8|nr:hypothetical protein [Okeania sp. SIO1I7]NET24609.1 hypothetical protein [Okeania sp. SIO1I7]